MAANKVRRKLTAIFSADVEGYSRLMGEDELATVETLTSHKEIMQNLIRRHRGRVVDSTGDNLLAEFASVVDAVQCAVEIQQILKAKNDELPENRRMLFRIGINLGDVIEEGDRIFGDGVNIAARVESLAEGGGISLSGTAYDQLGKKLPLGYKYLGEQTVKNIEKPVRVYRILTEAEAAGKVIGVKRPKPMPWRWAAVAAVIVIVAAGAFAIWNFYVRPDVEPASVDRMAYPLPDKPSIAVLPFLNMSGDPKQEYLSDGITERIITGLSKIPKLFVIARQSAFVYKGQPVKIQQVAEELGVRYVMEGSVQKSGNRLRITAQLIDAIKGHHLWAENYDKELKDIFALQDDITMKIMTAMQVKLTLGEQRHILDKGTDNVEAYTKYIQAYEIYFKFDKQDNIVARRILKEAIALDPDFGLAYSLLGYTHYNDALFGWSKSPEQSLSQAKELVIKALALDDSLDCAHGLMGFLYKTEGEYEKALEESTRAVELAPNSERANSYLGFNLTYAGSSEEAIPIFKRAIRLSPFPTDVTFYGLGMANLFTGRYEEAISACKKSVDVNPGNLMSHILLTAAYGAAGREDEARAEAEEILKINPGLSVDYVARTWSFKRKADKEVLVNALRKAGLPEKPPLPLPDKPSIAVLPFVNMSGDPEQEYFSDGISEEIITALSKTPKLFVIARTSSFKYKGKEVDVRIVGRELGVRYVLEGSVRKSGGKVRITAQLIDAISRHHIWAERYDRDLKDIFALQDEITKKILIEMQVKLTTGEEARVFGKGTSNLEAYLNVLQALKYINRTNEQDIVRARQVAEQAIALDPEYALAYVMLAWTHFFDVVYRSSKSPKQSLARASQLAHKALAIDESRGGAHVILGYIYLRKRQHEKAIAEMEQALALVPNSARNHMHMGRALTFAGRLEEAIPLLEKALRLDPIPGAVELYSLGHAYIMTGRYNEAITTCKKAIKIEPKSLIAHLYLTFAYSLSGREQEARTEAEVLLRINPKSCVPRRPEFYKNQEDFERFTDALRKAGLPDCPSRRGYE